MRLNDEIVRQGLATDGNSSPAISELIGEKNKFELTRRELLSIAATLGSVYALDTLYMGTARFNFKPGRAAFSIRGEERWIIDTRRFSGNPRLNVDNTGKQILISLSGARFPGTLLSADFMCRLTPTLKGWRMNLQMAGGLHAFVSLEKWLLGLVKASGTTSSGLQIGQNKKIMAGKIAGGTRYNFKPDWSMVYTGSSASELHLPDASITANELIVRLPHATSQPLLKHSAKRKAIIEPVIEKDRSHFSSFSEEETDWRFSERVHNVKKLRVELAESTRGRVYGGYLAEVEHAGNPLLVHPSPALCSSSGTASSIALSNIHYASAFDGNKIQTILSAEIDQNPRWLQAGEYSVMLAGSEKLHRFELELLNGAVRRVSCNAALVGSMLPPGGGRVIARPTGAYAGESLQILYGNRMPGRRSGKNILLIPPDNSSRPSLQLSNARVEMIRPDDLLVLGFEFINMELIDGPLRRSNVLRPRGSGQAYMVVYHQPQNIAEQAFLESAQAQLGEGADQGEPLSPPPVMSMYSDESRVVVKIPPGTDIPYTLEALLKAVREHEMSVPGNALPPPVIVNASLHNSLTDALTFAGIQYDTVQGTGQPGLTDTRGFSGISISRQSAETSAVASLRGLGMISRGTREFAGRPETQSVTRIIRSHRDIEITGKSSITSILYGEPAEVYNQTATLATPLPAPPQPYQTALEVPFRLIISPHAGEGWVHSDKPVISPKTGRVELWHSRLGIRLFNNMMDDRHPGRTVRAVWYRDNYPDAQKQDYTNVPPASNTPFRMSLNAGDRHNLVHLSSNFHIGGFTPGPVSVRNLMLSSLGAWIDVRGAWEPPAALSVEEWLHRGTLGRDHYVKVVYAGNLFPFGHKASLIKITERKINAHPELPNVPVAYLRQRFFIIVREPVVFKALGNSSRDRQMPFKSIEITSLSTPILDDPADSALIPADPDRIFWPRVGGEDFRFNLRMEDVEGNTAETTMPLAFIKQGTSQSQINSLIANFNENGPDERRTRPFSGQKISLAPAGLPGDTDFEAENITFRAESVSGGLGYEPVMYEAGLHVQALTQMTGIPVTKVHFHQAYLDNGFGAGNQDGQVLLEMDTGDVKDLNFEGKGDRSGGFVQPNMKVSGISRSLGPIGGDLDTAVSGQFDPEKYFGGGEENISLQSAFSPKLFGVIDLWDIIEAAGLNDKEKVPTMVTESLDLVERFMKDLDSVRQICNLLTGESVNDAAHAEDTAAQIISAISGFLADPSSFSAGTLQGQLNQLNSQLTNVKQQLTPQAIPVESLRREAERAIRLVLELIDSAQKITAILARIEDFANAVELAKQMRIRLEWKPSIKNWPSSNSIFVASNDKTGRQASFVLSVEMQAQQENINGSGGAGFEVMCCLDHFTVNLIGSTSFIKLYFKKMAFFARTGQKAGIDVDLQGIEFAGPLSFIEKLRSLIPLDGFSDPPFVDVDANGITAGFDFEIPTVGMGVFTLQNVVLGAKLNIPFIGDPLSITFFFNTRENPCSITVLGIGGGAYVGITVDMQGLQVIEAAIEFGGSVAFNIVVASGSVHIFAGIFFRLEKQGDATIIELAGYLRLGGKVKVLALIGISIEIRMELAYQVQVGQLVGKVIGRASLEVKVEILFFEVGVTLTVERKFSPRPDDPTFLDAMGDAYTDPVTSNIIQPWQQYCMAFAE